MHSGNARMMLSSLEAPRFIGFIYMYPDDVDAVWEHLRGTADIVAPLHPTDYGMREFSLRDPGGYTIARGGPDGQPHEH